MPNTYKNKVVYNGTTLIDLTADTVTASTLMQGYTAHDKSGALITGTASATGGVTQDQDGYLVLDDEGGGGGGGSTGLVYESGFWTPEEDVAKGTIAFSNTHTDPPAFFVVTNTADEYTGDSVAAESCFYTRWDLMLGTTVYAANSYRIGCRTALGRSAASTWAVQNGQIDSLAGAELVATNTAIYPYSGASTRYWKAGYTYKWIAVWAPES